MEKISGRFLKETFLSNSAEKQNNNVKNWKLTVIYKNEIRKPVSFFNFFNARCSLIRNMDIQNVGRKKFRLLL
jgi:hypothetical protein